MIGSWPGSKRHSQCGRLGRATGKVRWPLRHVSVMTRPAASRSLIRAHTLMDSEPLMTPESTGEASAALAAFPAIADVTVIELDAGQAGQCLIAYGVPSGPGLDVAELHAHARKTLRNGSMPAAIMVVDPTAGNTDRRLDQMADARK
jgi:hypothetical protein